MTAVMASKLILGSGMMIVPAAAVEGITKGRAVKRLRGGS